MAEVTVAGTGVPWWSSDENDMYPYSSQPNLFTPPPPKNPFFEKK